MYHSRVLEHAPVTKWLYTMLDDCLTMIVKHGQQAISLCSVLSQRTMMMLVVASSKSGTWGNTSIGPCGDVVPPFVSHLNDPLCWGLPRFVRSGNARSSRFLWVRQAHAPIHMRVCQTKCKKQQMVR